MAYQQLHTWNLYDGKMLKSDLDQKYALEGAGEDTIGFDTVKAQRGP